MKTYFYDHFGLEVDPADPEERVLRVVSQANDFSSLIPDEPAGADATFGSIGMENLTVFHRDGKEVGRAYFFRESNKDPVFIQVPPTGVYARDRQQLEFLGDGKWEHRYTYDNGQLARKYRYRKDKLSGESIGFRENGDPHFVANYKEGLLDGELIEYSEDGEESKKMFRAGEPVE